MANDVSEKKILRSFMAMFVALAFGPNDYYSRSWPKLLTQPERERAPLPAMMADPDVPSGGGAVDCFGILRAPPPPPIRRPATFED